MLALARYCLIAGITLLAFSVASYVSVLVFARSRAPERVPVLAGRGGPAPAAPPAAPGFGRDLVQYGTTFARVALLALTASLVFRALATGHGPFASQYEFSIAFGWGIVVAYVYFEYRYRIRMLALVVLPASMGLLLYAMTIGSEALPLVPALQNNVLLSMHVVVAILAYGALAVACAAGVLYLIQPPEGRPGLPRPAVLDDVSYRAVVLAFPLLTLVLVLGALWAEIAWGKYWSWDPKETASLVTWCIYGAYLHARAVRGWQGRRAAWLLMLGFAAVLFTFFGNLFFGGLHSYSGLD
jgi:ABC-type transport system involved in cytochrome c biogenesis permease subunit